jgi:hypothetical protein
MKIGNVRLDGGEVLIRPGPQRFYGPKSEVQKIAKAVGAQYNYQLNEFVVDCNQVDNLPQLTLKINNHGYVHTLTSKDFIVRVCFRIFYSAYLFKFKCKILGSRPTASLHSTLFSGTT